MVLLTADHVRQHGATDVRLTRVYFHGAERTKNSALLTEAKPLFKAKTFRDLMNCAYEVRDRLEKDGLFDQVAVLIDVDKSQSPLENGYEVTFVGKEPSLSKGKVSVDFTNRGESSIVMTGEGLNIFGSGEAALAELSKGSQHSTSLRFGFVKPLLKWRDARLGLHAYRNSAAYPWSGFSCVDQCLGVDLTHELVKNLVQHQIKYAASWRHVSVAGDLGDSAPFSIRQYAGPSLKSSVQSTLTLDTRDDVMLATRGILLRLCNELAGANGILGGDVNLTRHEAHAQFNTSLPLGFILALGVKATYIRPLGLSGAPDRPSLNVIDRTFLGGACDLRGFEHNGVGPSDDDHFLGGCAAWCAVLHLYKRLWPSFLFAHAFVAAGNVAATRDADASSLLDALSVERRSAVGVGLLLKVSRALRLELNYCVPCAYKSTDRARHGFQFGIGYQFV